MNKISTTFKIPGSVAGLLLLFSAMINAQDVPKEIADTFKIDAKGRQTGMSLDGQAVECGNAKWSVIQGTTAILTSKGTISIQHWWDHSQASVPVELPKQAVTLSADVRPFTCDWISIAFLEKSGSANWFSDENHIWIYLKSNGFAQLWRGKSAMVTVYGPTGFDPSVFHKLCLSYDPDSNAIAASLDGQSIIKPTDLGGFRPQIHAVGFRINRNPDGQQAGEPQIDNFKYQITQ